MFCTESEVAALTEALFRQGISEIYTPPDKPKDIGNNLTSRLFINSPAISENIVMLEYILVKLGQVVESKFKNLPLFEKFHVVCPVPHRAGYLASPVARYLKLPLLQFKEERGKYWSDSPHLKRYEGGTALLVDDVLTTGGSSSKVADYLLERKITPTFLICLMDRGLGGREELKKRRVSVECLLTAQAIIKALLQRKEEDGRKLPSMLTPEQESTIREELNLLSRAEA